MTENTQLDNALLPGLVRLPNELLLEIAPALRIADLRRLSGVSRKFYFFIHDYLIRYRYKAGIFRLPNELLLEIVQQLDSQKDRSCFARASQRFYPLVMNYIVSHNARHGGSSLLNYAAKQNLEGMARKILFIGGNVDTEYGSAGAVPNSQRRFTTSRLTPLAIAAQYGNKSLVRLFLEAGACQVIGGVRVPLGLALAARHESVAMMLSRGLYSDYQFEEKGQTVLQLACEARFVKLARYFFERGPGSHTDDQCASDCSITLFRLLEATACKGDFIRRQLLEDVFQITMMLLKHDADPDMCMEQGRCRPSITTRNLASRHPDPRIRNLLSRAKPAPTITQKGSTPPLERSILDSSEDETYEFLEGQYPASSQYAVLWDFLDKPNTNSSILQDHEKAKYYGNEGDDRKLKSSELKALIQADLRTRMKKTEIFTDPFSNSYFPQLGTPKAIVRSADQKFWAKMPVKTVPVAQKPVLRAKRLEKPAKVEPFPQLGHPAPPSNGAGNSIWTEFLKNKDLRDKSEVQQVSLCDEAVGRGDSGNKKAKKKKWVPLAI
jgi:ankyrin repeat protein